MTSFIFTKSVSRYARCKPYAILNFRCQISEPAAPEVAADSVLPRPPAPTARRAQGGAVTLVLGGEET